MSVVEEITPERRAGPVAVRFAALAHEYGLDGAQAYALYQTVIHCRDPRAFAYVWGLIDCGTRLED